jgi:hypothetical protein
VGTRTRRDGHDQQDATAFGRQIHHVTSSRSQQETAHQPARIHSNDLSILITHPKLPATGRLGDWHLKFARGFTQSFREAKRHQFHVKVHQKSAARGQ